MRRPLPAADCPRGATLTGPSFPGRLFRISPGRIQVNALLNWMGTLILTLTWSVVLFLPVAAVWLAALHLLPLEPLSLWVAAVALIGGQIAAASAVAGILAPDVALRMRGWPPRTVRHAHLSPSLMGASVGAGLVCVVGYLVVIPGLLLQAMYILAGPVAVMEGRRAGSALARSRALVISNHGPLSLLLLVPFVLQVTFLAAAWILVIGPRADTGAIRDGAQIFAGMSLVFCSLHAHVAIAAHHEFCHEAYALSEDVLDVFD